MRCQQIRDSYKFYKMRKEEQIDRWRDRGEGEFSEIDKNIYFQSEWGNWVQIENYRRPITEKLPNIKI